MKKLLLVCIVALGIVSCGGSGKSGSGLPLYSAKDFDTTLNNKKVALYTLENGNGMVAQITNYGAHIVSLWVPAADGSFKDVVLGYPSIEHFLDPMNTFGGPVIGRYANRIAKGKYAIDGEEYSIAINNGENALHGGLENYSKKVWDAEKIKSEAGEDAVRMTYVSPDGEEGFPGSLTVTVTYTLTTDNKLELDYTAEVFEKPTILNLTNHAYFNLHGDRKQSVNTHILKLNADTYTPTDAGLVPTGEIAAVEGTALDFRQPTAVGARVMDDDPVFHDRFGYDHNYVVNRSKEGEEVFAAEVYEPSTGIVMTVTTTTPGIQIFTGKSRLPQETASPYYGSAIALEAQNFPDAPNHENFPSAVLRPDEAYRQVTTYGFTTRQ